MSTMVLAFYKGTRAENPHARIFDRLTCWRTGGRFSHCELVQDIISPHGLCWSASLREAAIASGLVTPGQFDAWVRPDRMV